MTCGPGGMAADYGGIAMATGCGAVLCQHIGGTVMESDWGARLGHGERGDIVLRIASSWQWHLKRQREPRERRRDVSTTTTMSCDELHNNSQMVRRRRERNYE